MRITDKDRSIYKLIDEVGFATVKQIGSIFFNDITYKNELAKKRLNCLIEHGYIKQAKSVNCNQHIFYTDDKLKRQTYHNIIVMDLYVKFNEMRKLEILHFEREKRWDNGKVISDAFISVSYNGNIKSYIVEVQASKNLWKSSVNKYANQDVLEEMAEACGGVLPTMIFVDEICHKIDDPNIPFEIVQVDMNLTDFPLIFS